MKLLKKTNFGNPILRKKAAAVDLRKISSKQFQALLKNMFLTMHDLQGVGLAAPQINKSLQLAVIEIEKSRIRPQVNPLRKMVIINPKIISHSKKMIQDWEGCLSLEGVRGSVPRYSEIVVKYFDEFGKPHTQKLKGFQARVFQHEIDHLNGILYVDRMKDMSTLSTLKEFKKRILGNGLKSK